MSLFLGIETSCDETAVALLEQESGFMASLVSSQTDLHQAYGGIVPELASRRHLEILIPLLEEIFRKSQRKREEVRAVAVTRGPGLVGALLVGMETARALSLSLGIPLFGVNHLAGHVYAAFIEKEISLPALALIVSGGHTELVLLNEAEEFKCLGSTRDDAAGETLDKIARFLGLSYPGGPEIERLASKGDPSYRAFPVGESENPLDFSFSGLKTSVIYHVQNRQQAGHQVPLADLCASFQKAVVDALVLKTRRALRLSGVKNLIACGGVAANSTLRKEMGLLSEQEGVRLWIPPHDLCTDNALMITRAGIASAQQGKFLSLSADIDPNLTLES